MTNKPTENSKAPGMTLRKILLYTLILILAGRGLFAFVVDFRENRNTKNFDRQYIGQTVGTEILKKEPETPSEAPVITETADKYLEIDSVYNPNGYAAPYCSYFRLKNKSSSETISGTFTYEQSAPLKGQQTINFQIPPGKWQVMVPCYTKDLKERFYFLAVDKPGKAG